MRVNLHFYFAAFFVGSTRYSMNRASDRLIRHRYGRMGDHQVDHNPRNCFVQIIQNLTPIDQSQ